MKIRLQAMAFLLLPFILLVLGGCERLLSSLLPEEEGPCSCFLQQMPEETRIGANTFGCYMNGQLAASQGCFQKEGMRNGSRFRGHVNGFLVEWLGWPAKEMNKTMWLEFRLKYGDLTIRIDTVLFMDGPNECVLDMTLKNDMQDYTGWVEAVVDLFFDERNQIVSGRFDDIRMEVSRPGTSGLDFEDSLPYDVQGDTISLHLTNGRFDVKYGQGS